MKTLYNTYAGKVTTLLRPGVQAPDFALPSSGGHNTSISLSEFRGQPVILAFYLADWSPVCTDQLVMLNHMQPLLKHHNAQVIGISTDTLWSHNAFAEARHFTFPLLSDFEPKGEASKTYGAYSYENGMANRALFLIDEKGIVFWSHSSHADLNPGIEGLLNAIESMHKSREYAEKNKFYAMS